MHTVKHTVDFRCFKHWILKHWGQARGNYVDRKGPVSLNTGNGARHINEKADVNVKRGAAAAASGHALRLTALEVLRCQRGNQERAEAKQKCKIIKNIDNNKYYYYSCNFPAKAKNQPINNNTGTWFVICYTHTHAARVRVCTVWCARQILSPQEMGFIHLV